MNGYICFYNGKSYEVKASSSYAAQQELAKLAKVPAKKHHMISVVLAERADGSEVVQNTSSIG